jgi:multidrug efflux pump
MSDVSVTGAARTPGIDSSTPVKILSPSTPFIKRPVATILLTFGVAAAGAVAFFQLPVAPLPQVDFPTISVVAQLPGASPEVVATTVATPLERHLSQIADVSEMTSVSTIGSVRINVQFGLNRDINGAARDVQGAINAARVDLPTSLRSNPTYRKVNPADSTILILALTSDTMRQGELYDAAVTVISQKLSQVEGVGEVVVGGSSLPAVRVELNPSALFKYGIGLEDVRAALASANAHSPKGDIQTDGRRFQIYSNDQATVAADYRDLIVGYRSGAPVRLRDVAEVVDGNENIRNAGLFNGKPAVLVNLYRQPGANIIATVDRALALLPELRASIPPAIDVTPAVDRSTTIRASLKEVQRTLGIAVILVILVVFLFLRSARATLVPSVAVPVSLVGTFGVMYLLGYSIDNLSLMALTVATGFVVDDAIVVLENISRHIEAGVPRLHAAIRGAGEVGFTVMSMSISLCAVFIPILLMGGIVGRLFREFAVTLSVAILVSLAVSLATTPMMCALLLKRTDHAHKGSVHRASEWVFDAMLGGYERSLRWALDHSLLVLLILLATIGINFYLYIIIPKGFFPQQDTGRMSGYIQGDQSISFQLMRPKMAQFIDILLKDPAVETAVGYTGGGGGYGGGQTNGAFVSVALKPLSQRDVTADQVIRRLRPQMAAIPGASMYLQANQDIRSGGRSANAQYQFTLQADTVEELYRWAPRILAELQRSSQLADVNSDQQDKGLETQVTIDRDTAARLGINVAQIDNTVYDAYGQRQVSTIYKSRQQYHVIMEVAPQYWQDPETLRDIFVSKSGGNATGTQTTNAVAGTVRGPPTVSSSSAAATAAAIAADAVRNLALNSIGNTGKGAASTGSAVSTNAEAMVPLSAVAHFSPGNIPLAVSHQGLFVATTMSFNLPIGVSLSDAVTAVNEAMNRIGVPASIHGSFQGTARVYEQSLKNQPYLILAALVAVYIVLGVLYESYIHPITILSTLPSAGVGAVLALMICKTEFSIISLIGVILLIGLVKKNAIMMIDFALEAQRSRGLSSYQAIFEACLLRFRPIMMTTNAALLGALPLAIGFGDGGELRRPLGISIVGGLILSQILTLYTTPVVYLYLDRLAIWLRGLRSDRSLGQARR